MGNSSLRPALVADATNFQADLPKFILQSKIGNGKLMKTYLMRCESNSIVVKVYMSYPDEELRTFAAELTRIWYTISPSRFPNLLPYQLWMKSVSRQSKSNVQPIYIIRQYLYSNLHDRISTRPFLTETEKLWILYQLFKCIETCHNLQIMHGDIKPENVLCTTSNWVVLTDFAAFKPVNVPSDNPSDFQYYFDSMNRPRCYVAPERFYNKSRLEARQRGFSTINGGEKNISASPTISGAIRRPSILSPASSLSAFEKSSENALLSDSVFGDAATAIRFKSGAISSTESDRSNGKRASTILAGMGISAGASVGIGGRDRVDYNEIAGDQGAGGSEKLYSVIDAGMDVFSLGCTIAEVILDGEPFLDLSGMLRYAGNDTGCSASSNCSSSSSSSSSSKDADSRSSTTASVDSNNHMHHLDLMGSPAKGALDRIWAGTGTGVGGEYPRSKLKQVIVHMTQRNPDKRLSIADYREQLEEHRSSSCSSTERTLSSINHNGGMNSNSGEIEREREAPFPAYFGDVLHPLFLRLHWEGVCPDQRIAIICESYGTLIKSITGESDELGHLFFLEALKGNHSTAIGNNSNDLKNSQGKAGHSNDNMTDANAEEKTAAKTKASLTELSTADLLLRCQQAIAEAEMRFNITGTRANSKDINSSSSSSGNLSRHTPQSGTVPMEEKPSFEKGFRSAGESRNGNSHLYFGTAQSPSGQRKEDRKRRGKGVIILVQLVTSTFRHLSLPRFKIASLMLLVHLGLCSCDDDVVLKRILPSLLLALSDPSSPVRAMSIRALTVLVSSVQSISLFESNLFPQYLFAPLSAAARDVEIPVRLAFSECLGALAETARRFLERSHLMALTRAASDARAAAAAAALSKINQIRSNRDSPTTSVTTAEVLLSDFHVHFPYDSKLRLLHDQVIRWIREVSSSSSLSAHTQKGDRERDNSMPMNASLTSTTGSSLVKRALLEDIGRLCVFFGQEATTDLLLTQILTFLNDQDWELRLAFCLKIPAVCAFLGPTVTSECILPFLENALADSEERVAAQSVRCITALVQLRLLSRLMTVDAMKSAAPLLLHPRLTIRQVSLALVEAAAVTLGPTDSAVFLLPLLRPALAHNLTGVLLTSETVSKALIEPLSWRAFRRTLGNRQAALIDSLYSPKDAHSTSLKTTAYGSDKGRESGERLQEGKNKNKSRDKDKDKRDDDEIHKDMGNSWIVSSSSRAINSFEYEDDQNDLVENEDESENDEDLWCEQSTPSSTVHHSGIASPFQREEINIDTDHAGDASGVQTHSTVPFEDASEPLKLQYVSEYVDLAAREYLSRATQGQGQGLGSSSKSGQVQGSSAFHVHVQVQESDIEIIRSRGRSLSLALGQVNHAPSAAATGLSEHLAHSLMVPNQILGIGSTGSSFSSATNLPLTATSPQSLQCLSESDRAIAVSILSDSHPEMVERGVSRSTLQAIFGVQFSDLRSDVINGFIRRGDSMASLSQTSRRNAVGVASSPSAPSSSFISSSTRPSGHIVEGAISTLRPTTVTGKEEVCKDGDDDKNKERISDRDKDKEKDRDGDRVGAATSVTAAHSSLEDSSGERALTLSLIGWLKALKVPPLPPDLGSLHHADGKPYSSFIDASNMAITETHSLPGLRSSTQVPWKYIRPSQGLSPPPPLTLMSILSEHTASVNRLAVSPDQSYFASGSSDCCVKIWQLKGLDKAAFPRSSITYTGHLRGVTDLCVIDSTHSVASSSHDGQIHVWRVELACSTAKKHLRAKDGSSSNGQGAASPGGKVPGSGLSVRGLSVVRTLDPADGSIIALKHFTSLMNSVVTYTTQRGTVAGWDLRSAGEAFRYSVRPEFGVPTCMTLPPSTSAPGWIIVGTSRGYLLLWDLRFNIMSAAWRHSSNGPIHKISSFRSHSPSNGAAPTSSSSSSSSSTSPEEEEDTYDTVDMDAEISNSSSFPSLKGRRGSGLGGVGDYLVVAAGLNETAVWGLPIPSSGASMKTFRAVPIATSRDKDGNKDIPRLISVPLPSHPSAPVQGAILSLVSPSYPTSTQPSSEPSIRAFVSYISPDDKSSYLISGGSDSLLRYWDWSTPSKCCVLSGLSPAQHRPSVVSFKGSFTSSSSSQRSANVDDRDTLNMRGDQFSSDSRGYSYKQDLGQGQGQGYCQSEAQRTDLHDLFICYDTEAPSRSMKSPSFQQAHLSQRDSKGTTHHVSTSEDAILDINGVQSSKRLLLSCSRDGLIKLWR